MRAFPRLATLIATITLAAALLPGCGLLSREKDPNPPVEINKKMPQQVAIRTLWKTRIGKGTDERALSLVPAIGSGRIFIAGGRGRLAAVNPQDGRVLWERETKIPFSGGPDVAGDVLVLGSTDGDVAAFSTRDGAQLWRARINSEVLSVPSIIGDVVLIHSIDDNVYALEMADGKERWRYSYPAPVLTLHGSSTPVPAGDGAIVGFSGGRLVFLELTQGIPLWEVTVTPPRGRSELDRIADIDADPVVVGDIAYVATYNGDLAAIQISTGQILWRRELSAHAGLTADEKALYITDSRDNVWAAEPSDGAGLWRQEGLLNRRVTAPALAGNYLVVGDLEGYVHWLSRTDGRLLGFERVAGERINHQPVVADGTVYVYGNDGTLAALRAGGAAAPTPLP